MIVEHLILQPWLLIYLHASGFRISNKTLNLLQGFAPIQPLEYQWGPALMLGDRVWLTVSVPAAIPEVLDGVEGQDSVQVSHTKLGTPFHYGPGLVSTG